ncbi:MAG: PQQ-dependent sugar dehydrogenase [Thaumarchaeota archaeon]|nr:PQQ-dependent sugar dehydrogenase [Nitrososphaerota archaeon]
MVPSPQPNPAPEPPEPQEPLRTLKVQVAFQNLFHERMVYVTHAGDGSNRLFVLLQRGLILVFPNQADVKSAEVFLDIFDKVNSAGNEEGLLGLAFDPNFTSNGYFYVHYTANPPRRSVISRFSVSDDPNKANKASELILLEVSQPYSNHNGGQLAFGPDGYLYIGLGDGGSGGDPHDNGQSRASLLGKILRIDVSKSSQNERYRLPPDNPFVSEQNMKGEIWAYGLRNPWRFSFDKVTGLFWVADVGQNNYEEVNIIEKGGNYGWNKMEGAHCYPPSVTNCNKEGLRMPIAEYNHDEGCSITGGYVYRGTKLKMLYGAYIYGDYCSGRIWALRHDGSKVTESFLLIDSNLTISSFGEDEAGELYILSFDGKIYSLVP